MIKMTINQLCEKIQLSPSVVEAGYISEEKEQFLKKMFYEDEQHFFEYIEKEKNKYQTLLYLYVKWAAESYEEYLAAGLPEQVYWDNQRDLKIWYDRCVKQTGIHGIKEYHWVAVSVKRGLYRLGRLQFEPAKLRENVVVNGKTFEKGTPILEVHIPEGEPLAADAVRESFEQAKHFFNEKQIYNYELFFCESWLLSPQLEFLLGEDSNILKFKHLFYVHEEVEARQAEERVFEKVEDDVQKYPEKTSLQRKLKEFLLEGKKVGMGCGVIIAEHR